MNQATAAIREDLPCPVCGSPQATDFFSIRNVPVTCAAVLPTAALALAVPKGDVNLLVCYDCGFVSNRSFDEALGEIGAIYESSQAASAHFSAYAKALATDWIARYQLRGKSVVEIGCGSGDFLRVMLQCGIGHAVGIDPLARTDTAGGGATPHFIAEKFSEEHLDIDAAALVCRHTLEHIKDVRSFLRLVQLWVQRDPSRVVLFELPASERIFAERAFWDIYYEHCNYFTQATLELALQLSGFAVLRSHIAYGNQYLLIEATAVGNPSSTSRLNRTTAENLTATYLAFALAAGESIRNCMQTLSSIGTQSDPIVLWQGASKTVGFLSALPDIACIGGAVDLSTSRHGRFLPGSGLPVHAPEMLVQLQPRHIVLMNPVYLDEVTAHVRKLGVAAQIHTVNDLLR